MPMAGSDIKRSGGATSYPQVPAVPIDQRAVEIDDIINITPSRRMSMEEHRLDAEEEALMREEEELRKAEAELEARAQLGAGMVAPPPVGLPPPTEFDVRHHSIARAALTRHRHHRHCPPCLRSDSPRCRRPPVPCPRCAHPRPPNLYHPTPSPLPHLSTPSCPSPLRHRHRPHRFGSRQRLCMHHSRSASIRRYVHP